MKKRCLIIYVGVGYSEFEYNWDRTYAFSINMMDGYENHKSMLFTPLENLGYNLDFALLTKKHKRYDEMVSFYNAIPLDYTDINQYEFNTMNKFHKMRENENTGFYYVGGRFLTLKTQIDDYDFYVVVRSDVLFKKKITELNIDYDKLNFLWPESPPQLFTPLREDFLRDGWHDLLWWEHNKRTNGLVINFFPKKYYNLYRSHIWREHLALYYMLKDTHPFFTMNDVNMIMGTKKGHVTDLRFETNPIYTFNKKIIFSGKDINVDNFGKLT